ncbi:hypothetical protein SO694_0000278 [Aureococcus anophagefferens]|uniref:Uncharacterized protein n=1 Tax=Aureococcus anophagefferens TaxID=44056 RepID=A0ABR1GCL9_AURAN
MERDEHPVLAVVADRTLASLEASLQVLELVGVSGLNASQRSRLRSIEERAAELNRDPLGLSDALSGSGAPRRRRAAALPSLQPSRPPPPPLSGRSQGSSSSGRSRSRRGRAEPDPLLADVAPPGSQVRPAARRAPVVSLEELERLDVASPFEPSPPDLEAAKGRALNAPIRIKKVSLR